MNVKDLKGQTIAFAASGGLDSCTITHWLTENGVKVVAFTADLAQPDETDFGSIEKRMRACGAVDFVAVPLQKEMAAIGIEGIQAQICYEGRYWNTTPLGRVVTTSGIVPAMKKKGISVFSHGATGRGNDQVRFQLITNMLEPGFNVYAPWRDETFLNRFGGRLQMIEYCEQHGLPIKASREKPYSTDANLLGLTHEAGKLESLETPAHFVTPEMGVWPENAPEKAEEFTVRFEKGWPVSVNGKKVDALQAMLTANEIGGKHAIGIGLHLVESRFVGIKSRGIYEAPGMELLGTCYMFLLQLVLDRRAREMFDNMSLLLAKQLYQGYWYDVASRMAREAIGQTADLVTGTVTVSLYKGNVAYVSTKDVPHSLFSNDSSMEAEGGFDHKDSEGFLGVLGVHARVIAHAGQTKGNKNGTPAHGVDGVPGWNGALDNGTD
ncbi:MAG TPA: argininosuccinate synthase [Alphaproteobacteria bacterium]|nr:argininosuccinate synthase [Alphaproteobacteria bacterium]